MAFSKSPVHLSGAPGPFYGVIFPDLYLNEGGQRAVGSVLDMVIERFGHGLFEETKSLSEKHECLIRSLENQENSQLISISRNIHVWPDYRGNRTPLRDSTIKGGIFGLDFQDSAASTEEKWVQLQKLYSSHVQAFALGTRFIMETLEKNGHQFELLYMCGGLQKNRVYVEAHSDVVQLPVVVPVCEESVAFGAAVLAACASGQFGGLENAMNSLGQNGRLVLPRRSMKEFYDKKYRIFRKFGDLILEAKKEMK